MAKKEGAVFEPVSSGSIAKILRETEGDLVIAIGTYDAFAPAGGIGAKLDDIMSSKSLQELVRDSGKRIVVAIGTYDAWPVPIPSEPPV